MTQSYMTRALRARDPRFARILAKLGHGTPEEQEAALDTGATATREPVKPVTLPRKERAEPKKAEGSAPKRSKSRKARKAK